MPWKHGRPLDQNRMLAQINGETTYRGSSHGCGTNERYTKGGACVHCARRVQQEQRQARAAELAAAAELRDSLAVDLESNDDEFFNAPTGDPWD